MKRYNAYKKGGRMKPTRSMVLSMRLPIESGKRLKRMANRHGWTPSDASARLVEEGFIKAVRIRVHRFFATHRQVGKPTFKGARLRRGS